MLVKGTLFSQYLYVLPLYLKFSQERQKHDFSLSGLTAGASGSGAFLAEWPEGTAGAAAGEGWPRETAAALSAGGWTASSGASLAATGSGTKTRTSCFQTRMLTNAFFASLEIYSAYASVEGAFVLVESFFEERAAFLGSAAFWVSMTLIWIYGAV